MDLGPDFRFFCGALGHPARDAGALRRLAAAVVDWDTIVDGARRHRVAPWALGAVQACRSPDIPADVVARLRRRSMVDRQRSLAQVAEVARLSGLFAEGGVRALALKGVALSAQLYGDPTRRTARDIDFLVDPDQFAQAQSVLLRAGYRRRRDQASPRRDAALLRSTKEVEYIHGTTNELVELHHRLTDNPHLLSCGFSLLWNDRDTVRLAPAADAGVATLARHRLPLYLCVHGADHAWGRLHWLMDFAAALAPAPGGHAPQVDDLVAHAESSALKWPFLHALTLAHDWLGVPIDSRRLAASRGAAPLRRRRWLLSRLYAPNDWHAVAPPGSWKRVLHDSLWERLYRFSLKSGWRYRANQVRREWFSAADADVVPLPEALSWLYPLVRPWGWLIRRLSPS